MVWPTTTTRVADGAMTIGGVSLIELAREFGTPLYIYDETTLRETARGFREAFAAAYPESRVVYAGKAFMNLALVQVMREEGLGLDVVSGGELFAGLQAGMPPAEISFHGNNKSREELREAIDAGVGKVMVDNEYELDLLAELTRGRPSPLPVMLRINPGVDVDTHEKISTGLADSKFGLPVSTGQAAAAVERAIAIPGIELIGYHAHVGSQLFDPQASLDSITELVRFAADMRQRHGVEMRHLSPGGGFGIAYETQDTPMPLSEWARSISDCVRAACEEHDMPLPMLTVEPGRSIAGPAGVAVYRVGARKELPGIRTYVSVDGGMADNIRPALYDARYTAMLASADPATRSKESVTIAGKYCESGDILIEDITLPELQPDDLLAIPASGAYCLAMASNYNLATRPAVVLVREGQARLIRRRESYDDVLQYDIPL